MMKNLVQTSVFLLLCLVVCCVSCTTSTTDVSPASSIVGKYKMSKMTITPLPKGVTQADVDKEAACNKNVVLEFTKTKIITSGKSCSGYDASDSNDYSISGSKIIVKGQESEFTLSGSQLTISYDFGKEVTKITYTRL